MALNFAGTNLTSPINRIRAGMVALAINCRAYLKGGFALRNLMGNAILTVANALHTIARLNDSTPNGPAGGYTLILGAGTTLYNNATPIATGLSGNPMSLVPFRPNASVQPWMYEADSAPQGSVTLATKYLINGVPVNFVTNGMNKVRSDGLIYKMGVKEPQLAPVVSTQNTSVAFGGTGSLLATAIPWTNYPLGTNSSFDYGETEGPPNLIPPIDGTAPFIIDVQNASFVTITALSLDGTVVINGTTGPVLTATASSRVTPGVPGYPGQFIQVIGSGGHPATASYVVGAFTDGSGNVIPAGVAPLFVPNVVDVGVAFGTSTPIPVPYGAVAFQVGINSEGNTFTQGGTPNSGIINFSGSVTTNALPTVTSILGEMTAYYWGDSPTTGPVANYIWKNPDDPSGSGPSRSSSTAVGSTSGNSFIFDATFVAGIPELPGIGNPTLPMTWFQLNPQEVVTSSYPVFSPAIKGVDGNTAYQNFNFCLTGFIFVPQPGNYYFTLTYKDALIWGIGGGATLVGSTVIAGSGPVNSQEGQTITVLNGYPLLPMAIETTGEDGGFAEITVEVNFPAAGLYPIEIDYDYWYHNNRILLMTASPTPTATPAIIPPLPASIRQQVQYRYVYRSSATGAQSNPSPESTAQALPVTANTVTSIWSNDPQIDVVDYYRIDSVTTDFTYVATGPNDDLGGGGTNTPITDSLLDTELGNQLLSYDNFEPFPSIDLPQKGVCSVSGGVITWISGGAIGGSETGFNPRWLAGTTILIGSPTSLPYVLIARPVGNTITIPDVPNGTNVQYEIAEPILAAQPLPYIWGPSDNINFSCGCGDPLRPGTMYWCEGNNLDSSPDTNQQDLTDPSEALVNGIYSEGRGIVFTIKRAIAVLPNFFNALATATGTTGSTWSVQTTGITRGLFISRCLAAEGGGNLFFRVDDGIHVSPGGLESKSITDETLYNLFAHEGSTPTPVTRNGVTIYPPDDTQPQKQKFSIDKSYLYYDYVDVSNVPHTLTFDLAAMGWMWDIYTPAATIHAPSEGPSTQGTLVGCADGTVRQLSSSGTEAQTATVLSSAIGGVGWQHLREISMEYTSSAPITLTCIAADADNGSYGPPSIIIPSSGGLPTELKVTPGPGKWKWMWFSFTWSDPTAQVFIEGFTGKVRDWGSPGPYKEMNPFGDEGGL